jgi:hypothetical protein
MIATTAEFTPKKEQKGINSYCIYSAYNPNWINGFCPETNSSLFIPAIPIKLKNEESIKYLIECELMLGRVKRVDFVAKTNPINTNDNRWEVFIHFEYWYNTYDVMVLRNLLEENDYVDITGTTLDNKNYFPLQNKIKFLRLMFNKTPIKETNLNAHQLADLLEREIIKNKNLENKIKELEMKLNLLNNN